MGPPTVLYGHGSSACVERFERDEALEILAGVPGGFVRATGAHSQQNDYNDGSGQQVATGTITPLRPKHGGKTVTNTQA